MTAIFRSLIKGEHMKTKITLDQVSEYLSQWRQEGGFCDLSIALDQGDVMYAANLIDGSGATEESSSMHDEIGRLAAKFNGLSHAKQMKHLDATFGHCVIFTCLSCNAVSFVPEDEAEDFKETQCCYSCLKSDFDAEKKWGQK